MKILLLDRLEADILDNLLSDHVVYRPDLLRKGPALLHRAVVENEIDAIITSREILPVLAEKWAASPSFPAYLVYVKVADWSEAPEIIVPEKYSKTNNLTILHAYGNTEENAYRNALATLESAYTYYEMKPLLPAYNTAAPLSTCRRVLIIGGGVVNVVTAYVLQQAGYDVHMLDEGPDPRENAPWTAYGCSRGGGDARMFTLSEMDNYHDKEISPAMNSLFRRNITEAGWNVYRHATLSRSELNWIEHFERIPVWLAHRYNMDIFAFNRESYPLWESWIEKEPELFAQSVLRKGILRLYSDAGHYASAIVRQNTIGATERLLTPERIAIEQPALADAVAAGHIAGGIQVVGFTINVHKLMHLLLDHLEQNGAELEWKQPVEKILFDSQSNVTGVYGARKTWEADHYVISPGAFGNTLLAGTRSQDKIHCVIGAWLQLPNIEPQLRNSLKLARKGHINEDANITLATDDMGQPILIIGSGYGHTGANPGNIDPGLLRQMYRGVIDTAEKYFPRAYRSAMEAGSIEDSLKYCVRPWTATGLGLFERVATQHGGTCIITGGHNTGGFAQSPAIAQAVLAALSGREHLMHYFYHPERGLAFLDPAQHLVLS